MKDVKAASRVPFKFALASDKAVLQQKGCGSCSSPVGAGGVKTPPVYRPQSGVPTLPLAAQPLQAKMASNSQGAQVIQRAEVTPPGFAELQVLHAQWDKDYRRSQNQGKDDGGDDGGDGGGDKKPGFKFEKGVTRGTCFSGAACTGRVMSSPHHKHNCCGGRRSSGGSYRDHLGSCSNC